jgi:heme iron utilization protein
VKLELSPILNLLHWAQASTLVTQSLQLPGYPYATVVPNVLDEQHRPILLISALAEHTKNLLADSKVSISLMEPGVDQVQDAQRMTLLGNAEQFEPSQALIDRYLRYVPPAEQYLALDFMFFRIVPKRLRYIGGVGKMGWIEAETLDAADSLSLLEETSLLAEAIPMAPRNVTLLGVDRYGFDFVVDGFRDRHILTGDNFKDALMTAVSRLS